MTRAASRWPSARPRADGTTYSRLISAASAEKRRSSKRRDKLQKQIAAMRGRLSNQAYTAKAPPHLVKQTQDQLAEAEAELAKLG